MLVTVGQGLKDGKHRLVFWRNAVLQKRDKIGVQLPLPLQI
jgi:hypothetical protein